MFNIILRGNSANSKIYHNGEEIKNISSVSISQQVGSIPTVHMEMIMNEGELFINEAIPSTVFNIIFPVKPSHTPTSLSLKRSSLASIV